MSGAIMNAWTNTRKAIAQRIGSIQREDAGCADPPNRGDGAITSSCGVEHRIRTGQDADGVHGRAAL
jgi:hypothetical protein